MGEACGAVVLDLDGTLVQTEKLKAISYTAPGFMTALGSCAGLPAYRLRTDAVTWWVDRAARPG